MPYIPPQQIQQQLLANFRARHALSTQSTYKSPQNHYFQYCRIYSIDPYLFSEQRIREFIAYKDCFGTLGPGAMRTHKYAIRAISLSMGLNLDVSEKAMPLLAGDIAGKRRLKPPGQNASKPIDITILRQMFRYLPTSDYDSQVWRALLAMNHDLIKRASETTHTMGVQHSPQLFQLTWNQGQSFPLPIIPQSLTYHYKIGKTNLDRKEKSATAICNCHLGICAVHEIHLLLRWRHQLQLDDYVFVLAPNILVTYTLLSDKLKSLSKSIGVDPVRYGKSHGLRKGGAQDQVEQGIPALVIANQASWASLRSMKPYFDSISESRKIAIYSKNKNKINK